MKNINLQDIFLNQARKDKIPVTIFLMNGYQLKGYVKGFDSYIVILDCEGKQNVVYKHAISTVSPSKSINILDASNENIDQTGGDK
ncbi:MAG: RNA chaperone Hfq [Ruminococcus sp.]|nr:RNA chaperone Hfq [Ruminococcus sp.]